MKIIEEIIQGKSINYISVKYNISNSVVSNWYIQYNKGELKEYLPSGEIYNMTDNKKYTQNEKLTIAKECIELGKDYKTICSKYKIKYNRLYNWVKNYYSSVEKSAFKEISKAQDKYEILYKLKCIEVENLKKENEILKKKRLFYGDDRKRGNLDKYLTVDALKDKYSINLICEVLKLNRSSYYE